MPDNSDYFDFEEEERDFDEDDFEARIWNLFVLINPNDEELALHSSKGSRRSNCARRSCTSG